MTDIRSVVDVVTRTRVLEPGSNPYLDEFRSVVESGTEGWVRFELRLPMVLEYAWAVPDEEAIRHLVSHGPLVELGCGLGYWAALVADRGGDIIAYDATLDPSQNQYVSDRGPWFDVRIGGPLAAADHPDRTLFLCWPPFDDTFAFDALSAYQGDTLIYVGEGPGGCTGDDIFHLLLEEEWEQVDWYQIPRFPTMHDSMYIYRRKR